MPSSYEYATKTGGTGTLQADSEQEALSKASTLSDANPRTGVMRVSVPTTINSNNLKDSSPFSLTPTAPTTGAAGLAGVTETRSKSVAEELASGNTLATGDLAKRAVTAEQDKNQSLNSYLDFALNRQGKTQLTDNAYKTSGVDQAEADLKDINQRILEEQVSRRRQLEEADKNPNGMLKGALDAYKSNIERESLAREADLSVIQLGRLGKYDSAKAVADRSVSVQLEKDQAKLDALKINYEDNKDLFSKAEQRAFESAQSDRQAQLETRKTELTTIKDFALKAMEQGADTNTVLSMLAAPDLKSALAVGGSYVTGDTGGLSGYSTQDLAYAQQYASTGTIPSGVKGAQFARVSEIAKTLPKTKGTIVDANTGVKSSSVGQAEQSDFAALQNILESSKRLKELNAQRSQGIVGGSLSATVGNVLSNTFGTRNIENEYATLRKSIVDDIARMQTGAALTKDEQAFYNDYLPGRFSEAFFLGANSDQKIDNFINAMDTRLQTRLGSYGLSSYGYSKVTAPDGNQYYVGDKIKNNQGIEGTILPDGSIYVPQEQASILGTGGISSIKIPKSSNLAYVNNNPGNLRFVGQDGAQPGKGGFAKFDTPEAGATALLHQVALDVSRGNTLSTFITKYAPPSENNTKQYIVDASKALGISASTKLTSQHIKALAKFVAKKESSSYLA